MNLDDLDFHLPEDRIALHPAPRRDGSRLLVLDRSSGALSDAVFHDLAGYLGPGDALVLNETKVVPARLQVRKQSTGGQVELLVVGRGPGGDGWLAMARPLRGLRSGEILAAEGGPLIEVVERLDDRLHFRIAEAVADGSDPTGLRDFHALAGEAGQIPLPPYIRRAPEPADVDRYQTVFARAEGSIAAPTAGLHFTDDLLEAIAARGTSIVRLVLHVGAGTFAPVRDDDPTKHRIDPEYYELTEAAAASINKCRERGGRVIAVGTTCVRALESCSQGEALAAGSGWTDLVITPRHRFSVVDAMVTNFHLPRSSLLMLVSSFAGHESMRRAYDHAVAGGYRFYSYGDAMFIHGDQP